MSIRLKMIREQRIGFLLLVGIILLLELMIHSSKLFFSDEVLVEELPVHITQELQPSKKIISKTIVERFNPNTYKKEDWIKLGFSEKQAETILKYKNLIGGTFSSKEQLKKCFVISEEKYSEISSFILLPENTQTTIEKEYPISKKSYSLTNFDPNLYGKKDWEKIGFSEKQAETILKYKTIVGGKFTSKEQLKKCFVISGNKYSEISPYIQISEILEPFKNQTKIKEEVQEKKELNSVTFKDLVSLIEDTSICGKIINFRKGLGGFVSKDQLQEVYGITPEMIKILSDNLELDISKVNKINLTNAKEIEIQNHIYLRKYKKKIIEFQQSGLDPIEAISQKDAKYALIIRYLH